MDRESSYLRAKFDDAYIRSAGDAVSSLLLSRGHRDKCEHAAIAAAETGHRNASLIIAK